MVNLNQKTLKTCPWWGFSTYQSYVTVVPRIIVHQCCSIPHSCDLIPIIPPGHNTSLLVCILSKPIVSFSEVIQDCSTPVTIGKTKLCSITKQAFAFIAHTCTFITKSWVFFFLMKRGQFTDVRIQMKYLGQIGEEHTISQWFVHFVNEHKRPNLLYWNCCITHHDCMRPALCWDWSRHYWWPKYSVQRTASESSAGLWSRLSWCSFPWRPGLWVSLLLFSWFCQPIIK